MSAARGIWEVARRELIEGWRSRATRVSFAIVLAIVVGGSVAATLGDDGPPTDDYALVGPRTAALAPALRLEAQAAGRRARVHSLPDRAAAARAVTSGRIDVAIVDGRLIVKRSRSGAPARVAQQAVTALGTLTRLQELGLTQRQALAALSARPLPVDVLEPDARDAERNRDVVMLGVLLLYLALIVYGTSVASSVTEEKSSRVVELLLTTLPPRRLLAGKVLGAGALGLGQLAFVCGAALAASHLAGGDELPPGAPATVALIVLWFVLGFAFYSVAYAAVGALASRQEDLQPAMAPLTVLMVGAYIGTMIALDDPNGTWAHIAAFLPPFAPLVVPGRVVLGDMGALELLAAIAVEVLATYLLVLVAARIYERAILRIGAPVSLRSALLGDAGARELLPVLPWRGHRRPPRPTE